MDARRKADFRAPRPFNYVVEENWGAVKKPAPSPAAAAEQLRIRDIQCALDAILAKKGAKLSATHALALFSVAEDAASLAGGAAPILRCCLQQLFECVFSPHVTVIGTQLMRGGGTSLTRAPWFDVCRDLQFELGQRAEGDDDAGDDLPPQGDPARKNVLAQLSVAKEIIQTANEQQNRLQLDASYVRCITHMMQRLHTGQWREERRSKLLQPLFKERRLQKHEAVKSAGGSGVVMINGRWVESHEVFDQPPEKQMPVQIVASSEQSTSEAGNHREDADTANSSSKGGKIEEKTDRGKVWKEIRFREVLLSQTETELSLIQVRNEYFEGLQLLQDLQLQKMIELQNYDDAILRINSRTFDETISALALPLSHSFSTKIKQLRAEESQLRKHLTFIVDTYGTTLQVSRVPSDLELMAQVIAKDKGFGKASGVRVGSGVEFNPKLAKSWRSYRERGGVDVSYIFRTEEQMALFMKTIVEEQANTTTPDGLLPLQEFFYVWLSSAYRDHFLALSTAFSMLVALETHSNTSAYAMIASNALENSDDLLSALRYRYLALIHSLFIAHYNALKASDASVLLDPQAVLNQWACAAYKGLNDSVARAASDEYYSTVFRLSLSERINPHAFAFTIAKMIQQRSDPRMKSLNFALRSLMHEGEGPFWKALSNARRTLQIDLSNTLIALEDMPSKFTLQELILVIINRSDIFEIRPMLDLFIQKVVPFSTIDEFSANALVVAKYAIGINPSRYVPQLQSWILSSLPSERRPESTNFENIEQQFDHEIEIITLFIGISLLTKQQVTGAIVSTSKK